MDSINMDNFSTNLLSNREASTTITISNFIPSSIQHQNWLNLPTQQTRNGILEENWSNKQSLLQQHHENAHNSSNQSSIDEISLEDLLVSWGVVKKGNNSNSISCQPPPPNIYNTSSLATHQIGELLGENHDNQQFLWKQYYENTHNNSQQSFSEEITFENFLMELGIIKKGHNPFRTSFQPSPSTIYDTSSLQTSLEGTSFGQVERMAYGDHWSPSSIMSGVDPREIFYEKEKMCMMKIKGHKQMVGDEDHQNLGNIMSKAYPTKVCYNTEGMMEIIEIGVQNTKVENGGHLESTMRGVSLEEICSSEMGSIKTKRIEGQQMDMGSLVNPASMDSLNIKPKIYNSKEMEADRSDRRKHKMYKTSEQQMEKKRKNKIKNRESASRSRARREAYRMDLELMVNRLRDENTRLKRDLEELEKEKAPKYMEQQESNNPGETDHALHRCNSYPC